MEPRVIGKVYSQINRKIMPSIRPRPPRINNDPKRVRPPRIVGGRFFVEALDFPVGKAYAPALFNILGEEQPISGVPDSGRFNGK
jgi:hypothetical protein